jgi:hypothetical protein
LRSNLPRGADGKLGRFRQAALLQPPKQVAPAVRVLPESIHDRQNILLAILVSADNHQHALTIAVETWREADPVRPDADMASSMVAARDARTF